MKHKIAVLVFFTLLSSFSFLACKKGCIDKNNKLVGECTDTVIVVCGCNGKSYQNPCEALKDGISKENQTSGSCD